MAVDYKNSLGRYRKYLSNLQNQPLWSASFWVGLTIVLVIVMVVFFLRPTLVIISGLLGQVREQKNLLTRIDSKISLLREAETSYNQTREGQDVLKRVLPEQPYWKELADFLALTASESGMIVSRIEVGNVLIAGKKIDSTADIRNQGISKNKLPDDIETVDFLIEANGEYAQIREVLRKVEDVGRILIINSAKINKNKDGSLFLSLDGDAAFFNYKAEKL